MMNFEAMVWRFYEIANWIMRIVLLNVMWMIFTLLGLGIFGFFPATAAMFTIVRKWLLGEKDIAVVKTFWHAYKTNFVQINIIGFVMGLIGLILYVDFRFFQASEYVVLSLLNFFIIFAAFIYFAVVLYLFPLYVHFKCNTMEYIKRSFIIVLGKPLHSIMMIVGSYLVYVVVSMMPVLILFISGSLLSIVLMWIALKTFPTYEIKAGEGQ